MSEPQTTRRSPRFKDLTGLRFGSLAVLNYAGKNKHNHPVWLCRCDCGKEKVIEGGALKQGLSKTCGCSSANGHHFKHRMTNTPEFQTWSSMLRRCYNRNCPDYQNYGARGIFVCERWKASFSNFFDDMGSRPDGHSIDRIDVNGNYEPNNCQWASRTVQNRNTRQNHKLTFDGKTLTISEWAEIIGVAPAAIFCRIRRGWSTERALTTPLDYSRQPKPTS
jgi:hypothetical protein